MILLQALTIEINGIALLLVLIVVGGSIGSDMGIRALISGILTAIIAFVVFVNGGQETLGIINPIYTNLPALFALLTGGNIAAAGNLAPIVIPFGLPLLARVVGFVLLGPLLGWLLNQLNWPGWYADGKPDDKNEPWARPLGAGGGVLLMLIYTETAVTFWQEFVAGGGNLGTNFVTTALSILPNMGLLPVIVGLVFIILLMVFNFPFIWAKRIKPDKK